MDTFAGDIPDLINGALIKDIETNLDNEYKTTSVTETMIAIYEDYVRPNLFPLIVFALLCLYLLIRYNLKQRGESSSKKTKQEANKLPPPDIFNVRENNADDIASYISDDYLLTDGENEQNKPISKNDNNLCNIVRNRVNFDFDKIES